MKTYLRRSRPSSPLSLNCPFCGGPISLSPRELIDGRDVRCPRCNDESTLVRERIEHSRRDQWSLIVREHEEERR